MAYLTEDIESEVAALKAEGGVLETEEIVTGGNGSSFVFMDVMGSRVQIYKPPPQRWQA